MMNHYRKREELTLTAIAALDALSRTRLGTVGGLVARLLAVTAGVLVLTRVGAGWYSQQRIACWVWKAHQSRR